MAISAQEVNKLRKMTGVGIMDCKKALTEADGDFEAAIEILRKKGQKIFSSRGERETSEGAIFIKTNTEQTQGLLLSFTCETDFVAKNEEFQTLGNAILDKAVEHQVSTVDAIKALTIDGLSVNDKIIELVGKIGEKIDISAVETIKGECVVPYIHAGNKLGVMVALKGINGTDVQAAGRDVAMQIAAMNPVALDKDDVDPSVIEKEIEIGKEQARKEGKPEEMLEKIAVGKLNRFYKDHTLLNQAFVKDNKLTVAKYLDGITSGLTVTQFKRVAIG